MHEGVVIFYLEEKGYGYLRVRGTREEFHFRRKHLVDTTLQAGDVVMFSLVKGKHGYFADQVRKIGVA